MAWDVWGEELLTADINVTPNLRVFQPVKFNKNIVLRAMRTWFIFYNDPALTNLTMQIYSNNGGAPGELLVASQTTHTKAELITLANGVKGMHFNFDFISLRGLDTFHFVPKATGYTGNSGSHLAWRKGWPDPVYRTNVDSTLVTLGIDPYMVSFLGADF